MATLTAHNLPGMPLNGGSSPALASKPRVLWPWPVFALGVAALVGVWLGRPYLRQNLPKVIGSVNGDHSQKDLQTMRNILERKPGEMDKALTLGQKILDQSSEHPQLVGETNYLMGCIFLKKAEDAAPQDTVDWQNARKHFERAQKEGVPGGDQSRLAFFQAKALHHLKSDPEGILKLLQDADAGDEKATLCRIRAESLMRTPNPDWKAALEASKQELSLLPTTVDSRTRAQVRLRLAELNLRLKDPVEAQKQIEGIDSDTPDAYFPSRTLRARIYQAEGNFAQAVNAWKLAASNPRATPQELAAIFCDLGMCYAKIHKPADAQEAWRQAQARGGEPGQAAAFRMAEAQLAEASHEQAVPLFEEALKGIVRPEDYHNSVLPREDVIKVLEQAGSMFRAQGDFANASKVAELFGHVAGLGRSSEMQAEIADAWGEKLLAESRQTPGQAGQQSLAEAKKQFQLAGTHAEEAARPDRPVAEQSEWLRKAAGYFLKGQSPLSLDSAIEMLNRVVLLNKGTPDAEVLYLKALAHEQRGQTKEALEAYKAIPANSPYTPRVRYQLAAIQLAEKATGREAQDQKLEQIAVELQKNLEPAVQQSDREVYELSMYRLAEVLYQRQDFATAETRFQAALNAYPKSREADKARYMLGRCYWYQAAIQSQALQTKNLPAKDQESIRKTYKQLLDKAKLPFEALENSLLDRETKTGLADNEKPFLRQTSFARAECYFFGQEYDDAVRLYNILRIRYEKQLEELVAISQLWQCYQYTNQSDKTGQMIDTFREALNKMPEDRFDNSTQVHNRKYWEDWLNSVSPQPASKQE
jgi:tetratricopeptide (TPR) repeat protein